MNPLSKIEPMKLSLRSESFDNPDYLFELKMDGFRSLAYISDGKCELVSRRDNVYKSFGPLCDVMAPLKVKSAILDGEIVCLDSEGRSVFYELLYRRGQPIFYAFDLLWLNGEDLRQLPLIERKKILWVLVKRAKESRVLYADHIEGRGVNFFRTVCERNLEGIVAKRKDGVYTSAAYWLKINNPLYTQAEGRRELFESMRHPGPKKAKLPAASVEKTGA
jgi:bifunctional non-homologous end joining protein LigD